MIEAIENKNGITIKQLKELVKDLPEQDEYGDDFELWVMDKDGHTSNIAKSIMQLNRGDLIVEIHFNSP
jgi:broad-specificity NMP kinase